MHHLTRIIPPSCMLAQARVTLSQPDLLWLSCPSQAVPVMVVAHCSFRLLCGIQTASQKWSCPIALWRVLGRSDSRQDLLVAVAPVMQQLIGTPFLVLPSFPGAQLAVGINDVEGCSCVVVLTADLQLQWHHPWSRPLASPRSESLWMQSLGMTCMLQGPHS